MGVVCALPPPLRVLPGRVGVLYPLFEDSAGLIEIPASLVRKAEALGGGATQARCVQVLSSGFPGILAGETVAVRCDAACLALEHGDYPWVPKGYEVRIYGVHEPVLNDEQDVVVFKVAP